MPSPIQHIVDFTVFKTGKTPPKPFPDTKPIKEDGTPYGPREFPPCNCSTCFDLWVALDIHHEYSSQELTANRDDVMLAILTQVADAWRHLQTLGGVCGGSCGLVLCEPKRMIGCEVIFKQFQETQTEDGKGGVVVRNYWRIEVRVGGSFKCCQEIM